jgi:hypothetical protein
MLLGLNSISISSTDIAQFGGCDVMLTAANNMRFFLQSFIADDWI